MSRKELLKKAVAWMIFHSRLLLLFRTFRVSILKKPRLTVLCYHRIVAKGELLSAQCVSPELFASHAQGFSNGYRILSVEEVESIHQGKVALKNDAVLFTFDDGYKDNHSNALPILSRYKIKAVFFVSSQPILDQQAYWIDVLSTMIGALFEDRENIAALEPKGYPQDVIKVVAAENKDLTLSEYGANIFQYLMALTENQKNEFIHQLQSICRHRGLTPSALPALMTQEQMTELMELGHEIGAHTETHPRLAKVTEDQLEREVGRSIQRFSEAFALMKYFAYPFGDASDLPSNKDTLLQQLTKLNIKLAFTTEHRSVSLKDHSLLLPRKVIAPQSFEQIAFKIELLSWQGMFQ